MLALSPKVYGNYYAISIGKLANQELAGSLGKLNESVQDAYLKWTFRCRIQFDESKHESRMSHATDRLLGAEKIHLLSVGYGRLKPKGFQPSPSRGQPSIC